VRISFPQGGSGEKTALWGGECDLVTLGGGGRLVILQGKNLQRGVEKKAQRGKPEKRKGERTIGDWQILGR